MYNDKIKVLNKKGLKGLNKASDKATEKLSIKPNFYSNRKEIFNKNYRLQSWKLLNNKWDCANIWNYLCDKIQYRSADGELSRELENKEIKDYLSGKFIDSSYKLEADLDKDLFMQGQPHYNVMFSNGYDSTSLIISHLEKGEYVIPFYVSFMEGTEIWADMTIKQLQKVYPNLLHDLVPLFSPIYGNCTEETGFSQQSIVTFYASKIRREYQKNAIATEIAFCMNDDAISYLNDLKELYQKGCACTYPVMEGCPLEFPLTKRKHIENFETVTDWMDRYKSSLFCTEFDCGDTEYHWILDKNGTLWGVTLHRGYDDYKKENKACYSDINAIIVKIKPTHYSKFIEDTIVILKQLEGKKK